MTDYDKFLIEIESGWIRAKTAYAYCSVSKPFFNLHIKPQVRRKKISRAFVLYNVDDLDKYKEGKLKWKLTKEERHELA